MNATLLFFGISTDLVGSTSLEFELKEHTSVKKFKEELQTQYPQLSQINSYAIAVNESYADDSLELKENDIIAIIPPVSGG